MVDYGTITSTLAYASQKKATSKERGHKNMARQLVIRRLSSALLSVWYLDVEKCFFTSLLEETYQWDNKRYEGQRSIYKTSHIDNFIGAQARMPRSKLYKGVQNQCGLQGALWSPPRCKICFIYSMKPWLWHQAHRRRHPGNKVELNLLLIIYVFWYRLLMLFSSS